MDDKSKGAKSLLFMDNFDQIFMSVFVQLEEHFVQHQANSCPKTAIEICGSSSTIQVVLKFLNRCVYFLIFMPIHASRNFSATVDDRSK